MSKVTGEDRETEILNCIQEAMSRALDTAKAYLLSSVRHEE